VLNAGTHPAFGVCVPSSCSEEEVRKGMLDYTKATADEHLATYLFLVHSCTSEDKRPEVDGVDAGFL